MDGIYTIFEQQQFTGQINLASDDVSVLLVNPEYTFNRQNNFVSDVSTFEVSGPNYSRQALTNKSVNRDDFNHWVTFNADNVTWTAINVGLVSAIIMYKSVTSDADSILIGYLGISPPHDTNSGVLSIKWNDVGILRLSSS